MTIFQKPFRAGIILPLFVLSVFPAIPAWSQNAPANSMSFIIDKTLAKDDSVRLLLAGSGTAVIDWGDGGRETVTLKAGNFYDKKGYLADFESRKSFLITHSYNARTNAASVTIEGNVASFDCSLNGISALDTGKNPALQELRCCMNRITSLDLSGNPALRILDCGNTGIKTLNLRANTALEFLTCWDTRITSLDISGNPALVSLSCSKTGITALDTSKNPALAHLFCGDSGITSLDLSSNPALEALACDGAAITALDLSSNSALVELNCYANEMSAEALDALFRSLPDRRGKKAGTFYYRFNPGSEDADPSIARGKNWTALD